jgi:mannose-6-phosphate isomerase
MPPLEPFLLERIALPKLWGGRSLAQVPGFALPPGADIGETWELYDRPEGSSRLRGRTTTIADLMRDHARELVGAGVPLAHGGRFPLLLKFLDAREALSVQVHPDDRQAAADDDGGKNEAWTVLKAGPDARITLGFQPGVDRRQFEAAVGTEDLTRLLWSFRPEVGDTVHIPPGTVHAIGPDVVVFEVQQNSDLTYRLHDWGRGRELHLEKAVAVANVAPGDTVPRERPIVAPIALPDGGTQLLATATFRMRRFALRQRLDVQPAGRYVTVTVIAGSGTLSWPGARAHGTLALATGDTALVPACTPTFALLPNEHLNDHLNVILCDPGAA